LNEATKNGFESKNNSRQTSPSKTPLFTKLMFDNSKTSACNDSFHKTSSTPPLEVIHFDSNKNKPSNVKGGHNATISLHEMNLNNINVEDGFIQKNHACLNDMENFIENETSNYNIELGSTSNSTHSMEENTKFSGQTTSLTTESRWLTTTPWKSPYRSTLHLELERIGSSSFGIENDENEQISSPPTTAAVADDPNVLIKHSSNPYSDFRLSMVTMIEEEGLQVFLIKVQNKNE
jgi:hypothetical protein